MGRPRLGEERLEKYTLMLEPSVQARLEAVMARLQAKMEVGKLDKAAVAREAFHRGLELMEARLRRKGASDAA